jgi:hypothetical protein
MTTSEYIVGIVDKSLQKFEIEEAIALAQKQTAEECALMAQEAGDNNLAYDILLHYIWKVNEKGDDVL